MIDHWPIFGPGQSPEIQIPSRCGQPLVCATERHLCLTVADIKEGRPVRQPRAPRTARLPGCPRVTLRTLNRHRTYFLRADRLIKTFVKTQNFRRSLQKAGILSNVPPALNRSKYSYLASEIAVYSPEEAAVILGGRETLDDCIAAKWLTPVRREHKMTRYSSADVRRCGLRLQKGEWPPAAQQKCKPAA